MDIQNPEHVDLKLEIQDQPPPSNIINEELDSYDIDFFVPWYGCGGNLKTTNNRYCYMIGFWLRLIYFAFSIAAQLLAFKNDCMPWDPTGLADFTTQSGIITNVYLIVTPWVYFVKDKTPKNPYVRVCMHLTTMCFVAEFALTIFYWAVLTHYYTFDSIQRHLFFLLYVISLISFEYTEVWWKDIWSI